MTGVFEDHLQLDAVVAYVDGELSLTAYQRASAHLMRCPHCAAEVNEQAAAQQCLRSAVLPTMPGSLFDILRSIPVAVPAARPLPGVVVDEASGQVSRAAGPVRADHPRGRRFRLGAGALVAGLAVGAVVAAAAGEHAATTPGPSRDVAHVTGTPTSPAVVARVISTRP